MTPWIQVYSNLTSHRKTGRLADALGLANSFVSPNVVAVGILISLWTWAIQNAIDGDLSGCSSRAIAEACRWNKKPEALVSALMDSGWMDRDGRLHDWDEYTYLIMEQEDNRKEKDRERAKRYRDNKRLKKNCDASRDASRDEGVTLTGESRENPLLHNITEHNITEQDNNSNFLSEERKKETKKESSTDAPDPWKNAQTWIKMAKNAKEFGWGSLEHYIAKARECGVIIDPETMEVTYV